MPLVIAGLTSIRSSPAVKCSPWANSTPARSESSDSSCAYARDRSASIASVKALRFSGRLRPISSTCPSRSSETVSMTPP
ncbi:MAG: hypothetical protein QOC62_1337 [Mycobacterium sp.]|nr:hypothetical protein [Mycobacterium sp.]